MNILLIMPTFYGYYKEISNELKKRGYQVCFVPDEINISFRDKIVRKVNNDILARRFDEYIISASDILSNKSFEKVILIFGGRYIKSSHVEYLRQKYLNAEFVYYTWDSINNFRGILDFYKLFDRKYSFDINDCRKYGFEFLPLFYSNMYEKKETRIVNDYCAIMTYGKEKALNYQKIKAVLPDTIKGYEYLFLRHKSTFIYNKLLYPSLYKTMKICDFKYVPLSKKDTYSTFAKSKAVIDCPMEGQNGLTMRTFEVLHLQRKLITTNKNIKLYDFYSSDNVFVVDEIEREIPLSFFETPFNKKYVLSKEYSIEFFVEKLLGK